MPWLLLSVATPRPRAEVVSGVLEDSGAVAVTLSGAGEEVLLEPRPGEAPLWHELRLEALLPPDADLKALKMALRALDAEVADVEFVADDDWQSRWRAHAVRACFADRLWLLPRDDPFDPVAAAGADAPPAVLRLDPGLAFGSGSHPTTRLCLEGLAERQLDGLRVLDYGCGSGILALAALLLGAAEVVAVDYDPQALTATRDNARWNGIEDARLLVQSPDAFAEAAAAPFDLVVANILANPLVELAPRLSAATAPAGTLMLSGLLAEQADMVRGAYGDVRFREPVREEEWVRLDGARIAR